METIDTLYAAAQKCYDNLYDAIVQLANHPDDDHCAMCEAMAHRDYDNAMEVWVLAREHAMIKAREKGELPF